MPYITRIRVGQCRNVMDLDLDLSTSTADNGASLPFRHLILTGPNGSGKSGILEHTAHDLRWSFFPEEEMEETKEEHTRLFRTNGLPQDLVLGIVNARASTSPEDVFALEWSAEWSEVQRAFADGSMIAVYLPSRRGIPHGDVVGPAKLDIDPRVLLPGHAISQKLLQFMVNKQFDMVYAKTNGDKSTAERNEEWFEEFQERMRWITGDQRLEVVFRHEQYAFYFKRSDGYLFDLSMLADGYAAVLGLMAEIILRIDAVQRARKDFTFEPQGIVIVDEIETHLHLKLQEQILPALTSFFPKLQFLVATHSPAVIASVKGAVVCDLETREQEPSDAYRGIPYGTLMTEHFGISSDIDLDSTRDLLRFRELAASTARTAEEGREMEELAGQLSKRSATLATEVWMVRHRMGGSQVQLGEKGT